MKRIILAVIAAGLIFQTIACVNRYQSGKFLITSSPNETYTVEFVGNPLAPEHFGYDHETRFNLLKNKQPIVENAFVDAYDWFDSDFAGMYPEHKWASDSVLRLGHDMTKSETSPDSLVISNDSEKTIKFLKIRIRDLLLVFDMPPRSKTKLLVPHQMGQSWVWANGEFTDGQPLKGNGANFFHRDKLTEPLRYCISIAEASIKVESPNMEGYFDFDKSRNPNIPKSSNCE